MPSENNDLERLAERGALLEGHFVLASGRHSPYYVQAARLTERPARLDRVLGPMLKELRVRRTPRTVLTAAMGGVPVGHQVAHRLDLRSLFAERDDANQLVLERDFELHGEEPVLLVEDVVTTGGTLGELRVLVEEAGAEVVGVLTLINRSGCSRWEGYDLNSVYELEIPTYTPEECPACAEGRPTVRPGSKKAEEASS